MKKNTLFLLAALSVGAAACQKVYTHLSYADLMVMEIKYLPETPEAYRNPTTVFVDTVQIVLDTKNPGNNVTLSAAFYQNVQKQVTDSLRQRGYTILTAADTTGGTKPDILVGIASLAILQTNIYYYYPSYYPPANPWWWFPYYPVFNASISYNGKLGIDAYNLTEVSSKSDISDALSIWSVHIDGEIGPTTGAYESLVRNYIGTAFEISPYFKKQ